MKMTKSENNKKYYEKSKTLYVCNPIKNNWCGKHSCFKNGGDCRLTVFKEYAMTDESGNAIKEGNP